MDENWKTDIGAALELERLLLDRQQRLGKITEADIDGALSADDPLAALRDLAYIDRERLIVQKALARVQAVQASLKSQQQVRERNERRHARVTHSETHRASHHR